MSSAWCLKKKKKILRRTNRDFPLKKKREREIFQLTGEGNNTVHGTRGKKTKQANI